MKLTTWCGSVIDTRDYGAGVWWLWALGWIRGGWTREALEMRRRAKIESGE